MNSNQNTKNNIVDDVDSLIQQHLKEFNKEDFLEFKWKS